MTGPGQAPGLPPLVTWQWCLVPRTEMITPLCVSHLFNVHAGLTVHHDSNFPGEHCVLLASWAQQLLLGWALSGSIGRFRLTILTSPPDS